MNHNRRWLTLAHEVKVYQLNNKSQHQNKRDFIIIEAQIRFCPLPPAPCPQKGI
jgi:hypothetical protein